MKKLITCLTLVGIIAFFSNVNAQTGIDCANAHLITALPFTQTGLNTASTGNTYSSSNACSSTYMNGNDYVFSFTPAADVYAKITLSNTGNAVGLFVSDLCFDNAAASCVASATSILGNPEIANVVMHAGTTYYILVSSNAIFGVNQTTAFDINIQELIQTDASVTAITQPISSCALGMQPVSVNIRNFGVDSLYNFDVVYNIPGVNTATETVTDTILPGQSLAYTFSNNANFTSTGQFQIKAYTSIAADPNQTNDTTIAFVTNYATITTYPYSQDFEVSNDTWTAGGTNSSWALGTPASAIINSAASGVNAWKTNLTGNYNSGENSYVESPCFDFTTLSRPNIAFKVWYQTPNTITSLVQTSIDNGASWQTLGGMTDPDWYSLPTGWVGTSGQWISVSHSLSSFANAANIKFRITYNAVTGTPTDGLAFDDIYIYDSPAEDLGIVEISNPNSNCGLSASENVTIKVVNYGTASQNSFDLKYSINGGTPVVQNISSVLNPGDTLTHTFTSTANLSSVGSYDIEATVLLIGDTINNNDTLLKTVSNSPVISTFPYTQGFESGASNWVAGGTSPSWALGTPADVVINSAASGVNSWKTNLTGNHNSGENSWVESPCFDFTSLVKPIIDLNVWYETTTLGSATVQASTDNGATWTNVGATGDPDNWYNGLIGGWSGNAGQWLFAKHLLDNLGGQPNVKLRISFNGGIVGGTAEGFAFDNIHIYDTPANDLGVVEILTPTSDCGLGMESVTVKIVNYGTAIQNNFPVRYSINGGTSFVTENVGAAINPGDTLTYLFSTQANLSTAATYNFVSTTNVSNDGNHSNDTAYTQVTNFAVISTYPYTQNFDGAASDWTAGGTSSSWALGTPAKPIINTAASGTKCWVTNLTGEHNASENSYVESPCMDFSTLSNPFIELSIWYETSVIGSGDLQVSTDDGLSWQTIGAAGDPNNWYNGLLGGWSGSSAGWLTAKHKLDNLGGAPNVKLRVHLNGGVFLTSEGIAFDNINIYNCIAPDAQFTNAPTGATVNFTNTSTNATTYMWNFGDGNTSTSTSPFHTYTTSGTYTVTLYAYNSCDVDSISQTVQITSGINDFANENGVSIYPNPGNGNFTLSISNAPASDIQLVVYDVTGKCIHSKIYTGSNNEFTKNINLSNLAKGVYTVKIQSGEFITIRKLIVQ